MPVQRLSQPYPFCLSIDRLAVPVHLGVPEEERREEQTVYVWVKLYYPYIPSGSDYQCYDSLCQSLLATARQKPVELVETLIMDLYRCLRRQIPSEVPIHVKLHKPLPASLVGYEVEGATVEYTDLLEGLA